MEALALLHGLNLAKSKGLYPLVIEIDCKELINKMTNSDCYFQNLVDDCKGLLQEVGDPPMKHIFREENGVADKLAK